MSFIRWTWIVCASVLAITAWQTLMEWLDDEC